jgi:predicted alpha/beta superfamily hydrolase
VTHWIARLAWLVAIGFGLPARAEDTAPPILPHQTFTLASKALGETRHINIYTPPGYATSTRAKYPVLYMPDCGEQEDFPHVIATVDAAIRASAMRPLIVVGIENTERRRDLTGPTDVAEDRKIAAHVGGSAAFRAFIRDELMPHIRTRVRGNGRSAIIGESLAGLFIVETLFLQPRLFDNYIALSPSLWWNNDALLRNATERLPTLAGLHRVLYLTAANEENIAPQTAQLAGMLRAHAPRDLRWLYEPMPQERHNTIYRAAAPRALRALFPPLEASAASH